MRKSNLTKIPADESLSGWDRAILEAKRRIAILKQSIRTFQDLRDSGVEFPEPTTQSEVGEGKRVTGKPA